MTILSIQFLSHTQTETYAEKIVRVTNDYRRENGLATLALNQRLSDAARIHAIDIASLSGHTGSDGNGHDYRATAAGLSLANSIRKTFSFRRMTTMRMKPYKVGFIHHHITPIC